eukprot:2290134-Prymnesium_polylepis.1
MPTSRGGGRPPSPNPPCSAPARTPETALCGGGLWGRGRACAGKPTGGRGAGGAAPAQPGGR